jgi:hypothetical protein
MVAFPFKKERIGVSIKKGFTRMFYELFHYLETFEKNLVERAESG